MIRTTYNIILFLCSTALFGQSASEQAAWDQAKADHTLASYKLFISQYPNHKFTAALEDCLFQLLNGNNGYTYILYKDYRLRDMPNVSGKLLAKLKSGDEVKITEQSVEKEEITIDNFNANTFWYKVDLNDTLSGWLFGAGLRASDDFYEACKLYIDQYPDSKKLPKVLELFKRAECNFWQIVKKEDKKSFYAEYLQYFPNGIYSTDAQLLVNIIDTEGCYYYTEGTKDMAYSEEIKINISGNEVNGTFSSGIIDFSGTDGILSGRRIGKRLDLQNEFENSDQETMLKQAVNYLITSEGLQKQELVRIDDQEKITLRKKNCE